MTFYALAILIGALTPALIAVLNVWDAAVYVTAELLDIAPVPIDTPLTVPQDRFPIEAAPITVSGYVSLAAVPIPTFP